MIIGAYAGEKDIHKIMAGSKEIIFGEPPWSEIVGLKSPNFTKSGVWWNSALLGSTEEQTLYTQKLGDTATWSFYPPETGNYTVSVYIPGPNSSNSTDTQYTITSLDGIWRETINQAVNAGRWVKIAVVSAAAGTALTIVLEAFNGNTRADAARITKTNSSTSNQYDSSGNQDTSTLMVIGNQSGFDVGKPKRMTITNVSDGTEFLIINKTNQATVYEGTVISQIADFTAFDNEGTYYVECQGVQSYSFEIRKYFMQKISVLPTLHFMDESRQDDFNLGGSTGYGWRDGHQFSFELNSLVLQYMANPSLYERLPRQISHLDNTEFEELSTQTEPDIIWIMKFAVMRYHDLGTKKSKTLHALIKEQLAYFLYVYPAIKQYVSEELYLKIRDFTIAQWSNPNCNLSWYEVANPDSNNLFLTQSRIGDIKGQLPPGHAILPNLLMYEVLERDGLPGSQAYFDAAFNNAQWLVNDVDLDDPAMTKGQRMSEHITMEGLTWFYEMYSEQTPEGTLGKIERWADVMISRSDNMWDLRKHADRNDVTDYMIDQWTGGLNKYNETGNVAGFMASALAVNRVLIDEVKIKRLEEIAYAQMDNVFGRNPFARHHSYDAPREIYGVEVGWSTFYEGGFGDLGNVTGTLDGSPKEMAYPFNPESPSGYTEGWVAFNAAWNASLAYQAGEDIEIKVFNETLSSELTTVTTGQTVAIRLKAPLNADYGVKEKGVVQVSYGTTETTLEVEELNVNDFYFMGEIVIPTGIDKIEFSYGLGIFKKMVSVAVF